MSSISDRSLITTSFVLLVIFAAATECRPQQQQAYLPPQPQPALQQQSQSSNTNQQTFYIPPAAPVQSSSSVTTGQQLPFLAQPSNQQSSLSSLSSPQLTQQPIQLHIPIPNDGVEEKKIYVQLPPQQQYYPQQSPQYRYPPRKHYKIILVRSPSPPPQPAPILPEIEEQTLVYVLVKKPDTPSLAELQQIQQQSVKLHKPEVYFITYKANDKKSDGGAGNNGSLDTATGNGISLEHIQKSIEHQQVSNNLEASSSSGGGGYSYNGSRKREAKDGADEQQ